MGAELKVISPDGPDMAPPADDRDDNRGAPSLYHLDKQMAVLNERLTALSTTMTAGFDASNRKMDDVITRYATKDDLEDVRKSVDAVQAQISWAVKIVIGIVLVGLVGLIISKNGLPRG